MNPARSISFTVHGKAEPKGSARGFVAHKAGEKPRAIVTSDNPNLKAWESTVRGVAQSLAGGVFFDGPVVLQLAFYVQRPKSVSAKKRPHLTTRPDLSKLIRGLEDALNGVLWKDDALVIQVTASKGYAAVGESSRAEVTITEVITADSALPLLPSVPSVTAADQPHNETRF